MENLGRFVSVSGISTADELEKINDISESKNFKFPLVIGYQLSNKSINQGTKNLRQPNFSDLESLARKTVEFGMIPAFHYYTKSLDTTLDDLRKLASKVYAPQALIQFNTLPLSNETLEDVKDIGFGIIFKVAVSDIKSGGYSVWQGSEVEDALSGNPETLFEQVRERKDFIDYAMFDPSHGTDFTLNLDRNSLAIRLGKKIISDPSLMHLGLVYAGGINPANVENLTRQLYENLPEDKICIDIESGVRNKDDSLNLNKVRDYLVNYSRSQEAIQSL